MHVLTRNRADYRAGSDNVIDGCCKAMLQAIEPCDAAEPLIRMAGGFDALDLFGKRQDVSLNGLDLPPEFTDDGNWATISSSRLSWTA